MQQSLLYHGGGETVIFPEIRKTKYTKDFSWGFYCTKNYEQAYRWALACLAYERSEQVNG